MKRSISRAATALTVAISLAGPAPAHDAERESVTPKFAQALANIPGKSMRVVEVDYALASPRSRTRMLRPPSSTPTFSLARWSRR